MHVEHNIKIEPYSESGFWKKVKRYFSSIGYASLEKIFQLYYALESDRCSAKEKAIIYGALAYLISPIDAIPDLTPILGYSDDLTLIASALYAVVKCIDDDVKLKAKRKLEEFS